MTNMLTFFVLTTKKGALVRQLQLDERIQVYMFGKEDVLYESNQEALNYEPDQSGFNILAQRVSGRGGKKYTTVYAVCR